MIPLKRYLLPRTDVNGFGTAIEQWSSQNKHTFLKGEVSKASLLEQCKTKSTKSNNSTILFLNNLSHSLLQTKNNSTFRTHNFKSHLIWMKKDSIKYH
jgi:hypothetical protein